jgi:hypothetical protein
MKLFSCRIVWYVMEELILEAWVLERVERKPRER